ncbi:Sugar lactone lactonase YvrE [Noviherbaspirillum humi]|uniref:Sugar lactone lactonase YvrE n=1 Tax=Noviherbaspirillum humi TaxID=1688639 RepID=A0A239IUF2_9BURK|nr:SMP-30/gluconolactonase/LRE family protein [Noviherbaspirillum humi]SNS97199.1 Sugar lactone lactonase YvrE [Noviherbaspirillum humi]
MNPSATSGPTLLVDGLAFAEAPRWHRNRLWFSDFHTERIHCLDEDGALQTVATVPGRPSGLGWLPDGRLLAVSMHNRSVLRREGDGWVTHAALDHLAPCDCNDMVVDARGRAYVGNFGFDLMAKEAPRPTVLIMVSPEGEASIAAADLLFPNGCIITPDGGTLIVAETFGQRLTAFDIAADGGLRRRRIWADLPGVSPDGICLDAEGAVWVASPPTREFLRVREGGEILQRIPVERQAIACALGGADRRTLYLVTGRVSNAQRALSDRTGRIHALRVEVPGDGLP